MDKRINKDAKRTEGDENEKQEKGKKERREKNEKKKRKRKKEIHFCWLLNLDYLEMQLVLKRTQRQLSEAI